jgi:sugar phosphate isomerase/epimerase
MDSTHLLSLASGVHPEFPPVVTMEAASKAGWDAAGIWIDLAVWTADTTRELKAIMHGTGILALDIEVIWLREGPIEDDHLRMIDIGREVGAANALVVSSDPDPDGTAEKLQQLCEHAGGDIRVALEFGLFTEVKSIKAAAEIVGRVTHPAVAMLIDPLHLSRTGGTPIDVAALNPLWFPYAQFCDAPNLSYEVSNIDAIIEEAVDGRLVPGEGVLPLKPLLEALPPAIPLSVELRSKALRDAYPDPTDRAKALLRGTRQFFSDK